ncbi:MAG: hypothetical protein DLM55_03515 [Acidimicrobiales bacterium]|nr:MAG: hypothetical protein DLM55_03515 [Acidimicrobiales bacterium]
MNKLFREEVLKGLSDATAQRIAGLAIPISPTDQGIELGSNSHLVVVAYAGELPSFRMLGIRAPGLSTGDEGIDLELVRLLEYLQGGDAISRNLYQGQGETKTVFPASSGWSRPWNSCAILTRNGPQIDNPEELQRQYVLVAADRELDGTVFSLIETELNNNDAARRNAFGPLVRRKTAGKPAAGFGPPHGRPVTQGSLGHRRPTTG